MPIGQQVFISYAHLDNERQWVARFHELMVPMLKTRLGRVPSVWRDKSLQGNDIFADEIVKQLSDAALLLSVVSPRYVESEWCLREAQTFCDLAQQSGGVVVDRKARIFKIVMMPPDSQDGLPAPMRDALGFEFYEMQDGEPLELDPRYGPEMGIKLETRTALLAGRISRMLKQLAVAPANDGAHSDKPAVYLAECSSDRRDVCDALREELESFGHAVYPDRELPRDEADYQAEVARLLALCKLSIHVVGSKYGAVPVGPTEESVVVMQNRLAVAAARQAGLKRVIWLPEGTTSAHPQQQAFINDLHTQPDTQFGADLITADLGKVKEVVMRALAPLAAPAPTPAAAGADAEPAEPGVYVIFDRPDLKATAPLRRSLAAAGRVVIPVFEGSAAEVREADEAALKECDLVLVYYGSGTQAWKSGVDSRVKKALASRNGRPFRAVHTWLAEPDNDYKSDLVDMGTRGVIDARAGFDAGLLAPLLGQLAELTAQAGGAPHG